MDVVDGRVSNLEDVVGNFIQSQTLFSRFLAQIWFLWNRKTQLEITYFMLVPQQEVRWLTIHVLYAF